MVLSLGLGITLLALVAPHLDRWLSRLNGSLAIELWWWKTLTIAMISTVSIT
jgi:hypothetical protein